VVDRTIDELPASPGSPACAAVGGGCTLRAAIDAANSLSSGGGVICLPAGTYPLTLGTDLVISKDVTIDGNSSVDTVIDGLDLTRIFTVQAGTAVLSNLELTKGSSKTPCSFACPRDGGAVLVLPGAAASFNFLVFSNNKSPASGGAVSVFSRSSLDVPNTDFVNNQATINGGAIANDGLLTLQFARFFSNQTISEGGAVFNSDSAGAGKASTITDAEFYSNTAGAGGGAIYDEFNALLAVDRATAGGNSAPQGSGLYNAGTIIVINSTISGNRNAGGPGVGFANGTVGIATIVNCTITGNSSTGAGFEIDQSGTTVSIVNSIASGDPSRNCSRPLTSLGNNIESGSTCGFTMAGDIQNTDPKLDATLRYNGGFEQTHVLLQSSAAIDAGTNTGCPSVDERGVARPQGARCDMGSVEMIGVTIADVSAAEGNSGTTPLVFTVTLSAPSPNVVTVDYATADGTAALADNDYLAAAGTLTFNFGEQVKTLTVPVVGDPKFEPDETFFVNLTNPTGGAAVVRSPATGTILNDDSFLPSVSINSVAVVKPPSGTVAAVFPVTLSFASAGPVQVFYATADGTAKSGVDYQGALSVLTIPAGATSGSITVLVYGNTIASGDKTFTVQIYSPTGATIGAGTATGTIQDRSALPSLTIGDASVVAGATGTTPAVFTLTLSPASSRTVSVNYQTADGTATAADQDYLPASGTVLFAPLETSKTVTVQVLPKSFLETRTFFVDLSPAVNAAVTRSRGIGTITRPYPTLSVGDAAVLAPGAGGAPGTALLPVNLSIPSAQTVTVSYATADKTAVAGVDYTAASGTLSFAPGETTKPVSVPVLPRDAVGPTKVFTLLLSGPSNAIVAKALGDCAIYDPSKPLPPGPFLFIDDVTVPRPSFSFAAHARVSVRLTGPSPVPISIFYTTKDGTAHAGTDYLATSGTLTIPTGVTRQTILVPVLRLPPGGGNKTFQISLADPFFGDLVPAAEATITIVGP